MTTFQQHPPTRLSAYAVAALTLLCAPAFTGCTNSSSTDGGASASASASVSDVVNPGPPPTPTGTWTPAASNAPEGPTAAASLPTRSATLTGSVAFGSKVTVRLTDVSAIAVKGVTPGETSGPAVRVKVTVTNGSTAAINLDSATVSLVTDKGDPGIGTTAGNANPLQGRVAPGATGSGTYIFMLSPAKGRSVIVNVNYAAGQPIAVFTGRTV